MTTWLSVPYVTPWEIYTASVVLPFLGVVFVLLRFYARTLQKKSTGIDDWLMLPALILVTGMGISLIIGFVVDIASNAISLTHKAGVHKKAFAYSHNDNLTLDEAYVDPTTDLMEKIQYAFLILMVLAFGIIKLSITFYYRRIFVTANLNGLLFDWTTKAAIAIVLLWTIGCLFAFIFSCGIHISANWGNDQDWTMYCGPSNYASSAFVVSDLITDVMVLCLPLPVIWKLQMKIGNKLMVTGILATGAVSIVASIIKVIVSFEITNAGPDTNLDPDLGVSNILYWSMIEGGLGVIAACLPTLRLLARNVSISRHFHSLRGAFSFSSIDTQPRKWYQRSPTRSKKSHTYIHAGSFTSSASDAAREENNNPIDNLVTGNVGSHSDPQGHGIQVTRHFSQHTSIV